MSFYAHLDALMAQHATDGYIRAFQESTANGLTGACKGLFDDIECHGPLGQVVDAR
jgi:hypothetical protein